MKKIFFVLMSLIAALSFSSAFADVKPSPLSYHTSQETLSNAFNPANLATDIKIKNNTPFVVGVIEPRRMVLEPFNKVEHIYHDTWAGPTRIVIWDEKDHMIFFDREVWNHAFLTINYDYRSGYYVTVN